MIKRIKIVLLTFVFCSVFLSFYIIKESVAFSEYKNSIKNEQLTSASRMMVELADYLENNDVDGVNIISDMILRGGYVNSFSASNQAFIYDYLSYIRSDREYDVLKSSAYARAISKCAILELNGERFVLERYCDISDANSNHALQPIYKYGYNNQVIDYGDITCFYNGNRFVKFKVENETIDEYVSFVFESDFINMLQDVIMDIAKDQVEYVFSDMETEFYKTSRKYTEKNILDYINSVSSVHYDAIRYV